MNSSSLIMGTRTNSIEAEAYRSFRTNLQFANVGEKLKTILITSTGPCEGKSVTVANLAIALAQSGRSVIVVDCDLRRPVQHKLFSGGMRGLSNLLAGDAAAAELLQNTEFDNLRILASGPIPPNPSELLGSEKMSRILSELEAAADYLIIDTPPAVAVTDAAVLADKADGIVLVICVKQVRPEQAQKAKELLVNANGKLLGVILNKVEVASDDAYYYAYYGKT